MSFNYEKAPSPLRGIYVPEGAQVVLPYQYARFNELDAFTKDLGQVRDLIPFTQAYNTAWIGVCMQLDRKAQNGLAVDLKTRISADPTAPRLPEAAAYWDKLLDTSLYAYFKRNRDALRAQGYGVATVGGWKERDRARGGLKNRSIDRGMDLAAQVLPNVYEDDLINAVWHTKTAWAQDVRNLHDEVETHAGEKVLGYVSAIQLLVAARGLSIGRLTTMAEQLNDAYNGKTVYEVPNPKVSIDRLLKKAEPYTVFSGRMNNALTKVGQDLYGENATLARALWTTASHLRFGFLEKSASHKSIREPLVQLIAEGDFDNARYYIEDLMANFPRLIPNFVSDHLGIEPELLRSLYYESEAAASSKEESAESRVRREAIELITPLKRKLLVSADGELSLEIFDVDVERFYSERYRGRYWVKTNNKGRLFETAPKRRRSPVMKPQDIAALIELYGFKPKEA